MHVVTAAIHRVERPASMGAGFGDLCFYGFSLLVGENAGILRHAGFRFQLPDGIGDQPAAVILNPTPGIARKPGAVGYPGEEVANGVFVQG